MDQPDKAQAAISKLSSGKLGNVKVLMIEDDSFFTELVLSKLAKEGCIPYSSANGEEALSLAEQYHPNIIILDLMLPGVQGEEVLQKIKSNQTLQVIPVIVFSNKSDQVDIDSNLKAGAEAFLIKSTTDLNNLVNIIHDVVTRKQGQAAA